MARMFSPTPLHISAFEIEKRHCLRGLKTYIADHITLARPVATCRTVDEGVRGVRGGGVRLEEWSNLRFAFRSNPK